MNNQICCTEALARRVRVVPDTVALRGVKALMLFAVVSLLGACAVGNRYDYRINSMPLAVKGSGDIGLIVSDQRPYVLNKNKSPDFVGLQRGGFGNPFDVRTESGRPMAQDMADSLKSALDRQGFRVTLLEGDSIEPTVLARHANERGLRQVVVLRIKDWKTDTMANTDLIYDLQLLIVDRSGKVVAQNAINGVSPIGGGLPTTIGAQARQAFETKIGQLFYPPEIRDAMAQR